MNFQSQKMAVQSLVRVNRDYIAKNSKKSKNGHNFVKNEKFKNLKKYFFGIPEMHLNTKFYLSSFIGLVLSCLVCDPRSSSNQPLQTS